MVDQYDLNAFAAALNDVDLNTYAEVIAALRSHDKMKVLSLVGKLSPDKIDEFFNIFMGVYEDYYTPEIMDDDSDDSEESDDDTIVGKTIKVITGTNKNSNVNKQINVNNANNINTNNANGQNINQNNEIKHTVKENKTLEKSIQKAHNNVNSKKFMKKTMN